MARSFFKQLALLLWKNWKLKTTLPFGLLLTLTEVGWPLFLFIIMGAMRLSFPPEPHADSIYRPKALPSAGLLPFLQTMVCDLHDDPLLEWAENGSFPDMFPDASVNQVYKELDQMSQSGFGITPLCNSANTLLDISNLLGNSPQVTTVGNLLKNQSQFQEFLERRYNITPELARELLQARLNVNALPGLALLVPSYLSNVTTLLSPDSLRVLVCDTPLLTTAIELKRASAEELKGDLCNPRSGTTPPDLTDLADELRSELDLSKLSNPIGTQDPLQLAQEVASSVRQVTALQRLASLAPSQEGGCGNNTGNTTLDSMVCFLCGEGFSKNPFLAFLGNVFTRQDDLDSKLHSKKSTRNVIPKGQFRPKIFYAPNNTSVTDDIIRRANRTFAAIGDFSDAMDKAINCSDEVVRRIPPGSLQARNLDLLMKWLVTGRDDVTTPGGIVLSQLIPDSTREALLGNLTHDQRVQLYEAFDLYSPGNIWVMIANMQSVMTQVKGLLAKVDWDMFYGVENETEMEKWAADYSLVQKANFTYIFAGVVFPDIPTDPADLRNVTVKIRMNTTYVHETDVIRSKIWFPGPERKIWKQRYFDAGFIFLQDMIERAVLEAVSHKNITAPGVYVQEMAYPCYNEDKYTQSIQIMLPIVMTLAWLFTVSMTVRGVVREKESRLKEVMKMMGLGRLAHWLSWFITIYAILSISVVLITAIMYAFQMIIYSNFFLVWVFLEVYAAVLVLFCFVMSLSFNSANVSASVSGLVYFLTIFVSIVVWLRQGLSPAVVLVVPSVIAPVGFSIGASYLAQYELQQVGLQFANINSSPVQEDHFSFLYSLLMLVFDGILYIIAVWYIDAVFPGKYGTAKPWHFPFHLSYWVGKSRALRITSLLTRKRNSGRLSVSAEDGMAGDDEEDVLLNPVASDTEDEMEDTSHQFEQEPTGLPVGIEIRNLVKVYSNCYGKRRGGVVAVNDLSLNLYEGQITAFLGHNGAGKTTTMALLTGLYEPTAGTAYINGLNIQKDLDEIRESLGFCPQHNVLFDDLTVWDHVVFFAAVKGMPWKEAKVEAKEWLEKVGMMEFWKMKAKHLSGGMKRKLSILLAFVGNSRTIILDEPTSGVDPYARRQIWDFLSKSRQGHTIMLATHHMDEAEILGDRIAIISKGELLCCGSFFFLKKQFGKGHQLVVALQRRGEEVPGDHTDGQVQDVSDFVTSLIPGAKLVETNGADMKFLLPLRNTGPQTLARMFDILDRDMQRFYVDSYGFKSCSLEEVFVRVTSANGDPEELSDDVVFREAVDAPLTSDSRRESRSSVSSSEGGRRSSVTSDGKREGRSSVSSSEGGRQSSASCADVPDSSPSNYDVTNGEDEVPLMESQAEEAREGMGEAQDSSASGFLFVLQLYALLLKRLQYACHRWILTKVQNLLPLAIVILCLVISWYLLQVESPIAFEFTPAQYTRDGFDNYMVVGGPNTEDTCHYFDQLYRPCGVGGNPTGSSSDPHSPCYWPDSNFTTCSSSLPKDLLSTCAPETPTVLARDCGSGSRSNYAPPLPHPPQCFSPNPESNWAQTFIQDLRHGNRTDYTEADGRLDMDYLLWSTSKFIQNRYGGVVFGVNRSEIAASVDEIYKNTSSWYTAVHQGAKALFSYKGYHSMPTYLNVLNNAILRANLPPQADHTQYGIRTYSHPFATTWLQKLEKALESFSFVVNPLGLMFALAFLVAGYSVFLIEERSNKFLHLQQVCGLYKAVYWLAAYIWDSTSYTIFIVITLFLYLAFQDPNFTPRAVFPWFALTMFLFGHALMPWVYCLSLLFRSPTAAFIVIFCVYFFGGFAFLIVDSIVYIIAKEDVAGPYLLLFPFPMPTYALSRAFSFFSLDWIENQINASVNPVADVSPIIEGVWPYLLALLVYWIGGFFVLLVIELWIHFRGKCSRPHPVMPTVLEDSDVARERQRVLGGNTGMDVVTVNSLSKSYMSARRLAVNKLCFGVHRGECFGLLGVNGAGKTTTFKILTGDLAPSSGSAFVMTNDVVRDKSAARKNLGYCPQFEGLLDHITGWQHLALFARLRGHHGAKLTAMVDDALDRLQLREYANRTVGKYSGGNRRKLSTAIAMLTEPEIILLDEPTAGVDPEARRFLWEVIQGRVHSGQSVLLTTHSMAECEVLCSRVAIMVNGELKCIGSPQHLRERFGSGYRIKLRMKTSTFSLEPMMEFMKQNFHSAELKEAHHNVLVYQWVPHPQGLGQLHRLLDQAKEQLGLEEFSVSQTTLDDVFIHFASQQTDEATQVAVVVEEAQPAEFPPLPDIVSSASVAMSMLQAEEQV